MKKFYDFKNFKGDVTGGLVAGVIALPLALAFGVQSGMGAAAGLYGAIAVGIFAALFGGTETQASGPTGPMTVVSAALVAGDCLDQVRAGISDPAMTIAVSLNYYFREASTNEAWNTFVARCGLDGEHLLHQDPDQCLADVKRGATAGRFKSEDPAFTQNLVTGMVQHTLRQIAAGRLDGDAAKATTAHVLRMLGLPDLVARALADGRLPPIAAPRRTPITEAPANVTPLVVLSGETARNS